MRDLNLIRRMDRLENSLINLALVDSNWNISKAARLLRIQRTTLIAKMRKKGIGKLKQN